MYEEKPDGVGLDLNMLLVSAGLEPGEVVVLRHRPKEPEVRKILPWLILERPDLFQLYQSTQSGNAGPAVCRARYIAAFAGLAAGAATFAGLYEVGASRPMSAEEFWAMSGHVELASFGLKGYGTGAEDHIFIDLRAHALWQDWVGRLTIDWPAPERSWFRRAERNIMRVRAISEESQFAQHMPAWDDLVVTWDQLRIMPTSWRAALGQWRGVYFIFDAERKAGYVGSASGPDNILGRWQNYAQTGHGGNTLLRQSKPEDLSFSILQRTSPDMLPADVVALEIGWKARLHTKRFGLNAN